MVCVPTSGFPSRRSRAASQNGEHGVFSTQKPVGLGIWNGFRKDAFVMGCSVRVWQVQAAATLPWLVVKEVKLSYFNKIKQGFGFRVTIIRKPYDLLYIPIL